MGLSKSWHEIIFFPILILVFPYSFLLLGLFQDHLNSLPTYSAIIVAIENSVLYFSNLTTILGILLCAMAFSTLMAQDYFAFPRKWIVPLFWGGITLINRSVFYIRIALESQIEYCCQYLN